MADFRKCDGNCEACGKCRGERLLRELRSRKSELTYMPEGFHSAAGNSTVDSEPAYGNGSSAPGSSFANRSAAGASESGDRPGSGYGIAFDIGTTTVVGLCWDLAKRELLATDAARNPQVVHGGDVISRIGYSVREEENLEEMRQLVIDCLNEILDGFLEKLPVRRTEITEITAVGNTTMSHLLLGEDPEGLAASPFRPAFKGAVRESAAALGLRVPAKTAFYLLPGIAGHVGSDITAGLLALDLENKDSLDVFVDIGTNGEVAVTEKGRILVCSTAAGPAFEGAAIRQG
ncbi:MAG: ASKHA domain-containing protein, partial [Clostridiales bacterium]|nr:ASKHA domain-containing protein [Clostridiales bacterium]